jgi:hypothetical protein
MKEKTMSKLITKALAVTVAAGALFTVAATGTASAGGWYGGWHGWHGGWGYHHDRSYFYDRDYRFYDRDFRFRFRHY